MKKICSIIFLITPILADVPALPAWTTAAPAALPAMPELSSEEMARSCKDNNQKNNAITFVQQVRYLPILQTYLSDLKIDLNNRQNYIAGIKQNIAYLQQLSGQEQQTVTQLNAQIATYKTYLQQQQQQGAHNAVQQAMQQAAQNLQQDEQNLTKLQGELQTAQQKLQQSSTYVQWAKYVTTTFTTQSLPTYISGLQKYQQQYATAAKTQPAYARYAQQYADEVAIYQNFLSLYQLAQQIVQLAKGTSFDASYDSSNKTLTTTLFNTPVTQAELQEVQTDLAAYQQLNQQAQDITTSLPQEISAIAKDLPTGLAEELYNLNVQLAKIQETIQLRNETNAAITAMNSDIKTLQNQISAIVQVMQKDFQAAINQTVSTINNVSTALNNPPAGMFDGCPFFLKDLLQEA